MTELPKVPHNLLAHLNSLVSLYDTYEAAVSALQDASKSKNEEAVREAIAKLQSAQTRFLLDAHYLRDTLWFAKRCVEYLHHMPDSVRQFFTPEVTHPCH